MKAVQRLIYRFRNVTSPAAEAPLSPDSEIDLPEPHTRSFAGTLREWFNLEAKGLDYSRALTLEGS